MTAPVLLWIANKGTNAELTITKERDGSFGVDNTRNDRLGKLFEEFPRYSSSVKGCKIAAAKILQEKINWEKVEPESKPVSNPTHFLYTCRNCLVDTHTPINRSNPAATCTPKCHKCGSDSRRVMAYRGVSHGE